MPIKCVKSMYSISMFNSSRVFVESSGFIGFRIFNPKRLEDFFSKSFFLHS